MQVKRNFAKTWSQRAQTWSTKLQVKSNWKLCPSIYVKSVDIHLV